jgi:hypothetical protein
LPCWIQVIALLRLCPLVPHFSGSVCVCDLEANWNSQRSLINVHSLPLAQTLQTCSPLTLVLCQHLLPPTPADLLSEPASSSTTASSSSSTTSSWWSSATRCATASGARSHLPAVTWGKLSHPPSPAEAVLSCCNCCEWQPVALAAEAGAHERKAFAGGWRDWARSPVAAESSHRLTSRSRVSHCVGAVRVGRINGPGLAKSSASDDLASTCLDARFRVEL